MKLKCLPKMKISVDFPGDWCARVKTAELTTTDKGTGSLQNKQEKATGNYYAIGFEVLYDPDFSKIQVLEVPDFIHVAPMD